MLMGPAGPTSFPAGAYCVHGPVARALDPEQGPGWIVEDRSLLSCTPMLHLPHHNPQDRPWVRFKEACIVAALLWACLLAAHLVAWQALTALQACLPSGPCQEACR